MQAKVERIIAVIGTGGTIAGTAAPGTDIGYVSAQLGVADLVAAIPALAEPGWAGRIEVEQASQIDSKDMDFAVWLTLARRVAFHLARPELAGIVVTHGTDTLEETAFFLHRVLAPSKPVVLTAAMRPATALQADGPQNLHDAIRLADADADVPHGVMVVVGGAVFDPADIRKVHTHRLAAFGAGDAGVLAHIEAGRLRRHRGWPSGPRPLGVERLPPDPERWPRVEIVHSHVDAGGAVVRALCADGVHGIVAACTGNGTLHHRLEAALIAAQQQGVRVLRSSRCLGGAIIDPAGGSAAEVLPSAGALTPVQARIELMLQLMAGAAGDGSSR